jgi:hypothetical protein
MLHLASRKARWLLDVDLEWLHAVERELGGKRKRVLGRL